MPVAAINNDMKRTITFITGHYYHSARRAGFHNLADAAHRAGFQVNFVTTGYSLLSYLRRDYRTKVRGINKNLNRAIEVRPGFVSYVHFTAWHPMTLIVPALNRLSYSLMDAYGEMGLGKLSAIVENTDIFVFESSPGLFLFERIKRENPHAKMIYRVSDDLRTLRSPHPRLLDLEQEIAPHFNVVSVPTPWMLDIFKDVENVRVDRHGIDKKTYDDVVASPYNHGSKNTVFVGTFKLDEFFLEKAARAYSEVNFHIIGPVQSSVKRGNVHFYGEIPFKETVKYIKFADCGLLCNAYTNESSKVFSDCLKVIQYRYCGLPIVSPEFIDLNREGVYYYEPGNEDSIKESLKQAFLAGPDLSYADEVRSWDEVFKAILSASI